MDAKFRENVLDMMPHGMRAHVQLIGDLPVRRSAREQTGDLRLTPGQPEPSQCQLRRDLVVTREAHGDSHLERGEKQPEQRSRRVSWAVPARANGCLDVAVRDAQSGVSIRNWPVDVLAVADPTGGEDLAEEGRAP